MVNLSRIDIFSQNIEFTLEGNPKIQTTIGVFLTIIFFTAGIYAFYQNGKEVFLRENPNSFQQTSLSEDYLNITINRQTFPVSFQVTDINTNVVNLTNKLDIFLTEIKITSQGVGYPSTINELPHSYILEYPNSNNSNFIMSPNESVTLSGSWNINNINFLQFGVYLCNNNTKSTCDTRDEIFEFIGNNQLNFNFYYPDINLELDNFKIPINSQTINNYLFLTKETKYMRFFFRNNQIITDSGVLFSDLNKFEYLTVDSFFVDNSILSEDGSIFIASFISTNKTQIIRRSYLTIQAVISQVGGLFNVLYWIFLFLNSNFAKIKKNLLIMNSIFENEEVDFNENSDRQSKSKKMINLHSFSEFNNSKIKNKINQVIDFKNGNSINLRQSFNKSQNDKLEINIAQNLDLNFMKKIKNIEVKLTIKDICKSICCNCPLLKKSMNLDYYNLLSKIIDYYFDVVNYIRKLEEVEKLKKILLNENQLKIFNMIQSKIRDVDLEKIIKNEDEVSNLIQSISINPKNNIEKSIRKILINDKNLY